MALSPYTPADGAALATRSPLTSSKIDAPTLASLLAHYERFGDRAARVAAYKRRQQRKSQFGIDNLNDANAQQVRRAAEAGLIGRQQGDPHSIDGPVGPSPVYAAEGDPNAANGGPAGGKPVAAPVKPTVAEIAASAIEAPSSPGPYPSSPLAVALQAPGMNGIRRRRRVGASR